jgi:ABC-type transport system involved in cytochrome bd biosynthesis fused ATPase/permease subunit
MRRKPPAKMETPILIAVMGCTGAGKSSFVRLVTGNNEVKVGHHLTSSKSLKLPNDRGETNTCE